MCKLWNCKIYTYRINRGRIRMQEIQKSRQSSEAKRKDLLTRSALIRTEVEQLGTETQLLESIDKIEQNIKSARVDIRKYRDFLKNESNELDNLKKVLNDIKINKRRKIINDMKASVLVFCVFFIPNIFMSKMYYLSQIPKNTPISSLFIYMSVGDILFWIWVFVCIFYSTAYIYITIHYITPFIEKNPSLKIPTKFCSTSTFIFLYGQFLFYSAYLIPRLISPSWGPSVTNVLNLLIAFLTSNPMTALLALITIFPIAVNILKKYKSSMNLQMPWMKNRK